MARPGRKRKVGVERFPSGQIKKDEEAPSPALVKRATLMSMIGLAAPEFGTVMGLYFLSRRIDGYQYEGAKRYADLLSQYYGCVGGPKRPSSVDMGGTIKNAPIDPESAAGEREAQRHIDVLQRYNDAHAALNRAGRGVEDEVIRFCDGVGQTPTGHEAMLRLKLGLDTLVILWKVRGKK